jgi:hypothetical protein
MDAIRSSFQGRLVLPIIALIIGLAIGLFFAWMIVPVEWVDGVPEQMREDLRQDYLRMIIDSYSVNNNTNLAVSRYQNLGKHAESTLEYLATNPGALDPGALQAFRATVELFPPELPGQQPSGGDGGGSGGGIVDTVLKYLPYFCAVFVVILVVGIVVVFLRRRSESVEEYPEETYIPTVEYEPNELDMRFTESVDMSEPLATFRTIYSLGDDLYDDSFSIESPTGDFLGECGVGIGDIIGVGDPKKVSAFEVWLFDKNDIQTITKVLMSSYSYNDDEARSRLAAKGDPILAESGGIIELETASLRVEARIVDLTYGEGALPSGSFLERLAIELQAWSVG